MDTDGRKRDRSDNEINLAFAELESAVSRDPELKLKAMAAVKDLIDSKDESYQTQKVLAGEGIFAVLVQLLEDENENVSAMAAELLKAEVSHSEAALLRLEANSLTSASQVSLNPVQSEAASVDGLFRTLVNMLFGSSEVKEQAAQDAVTALSHLSRENSVEYLREIVHRLLQGEGSKALEKLDDVIGGLEIRDDVAVTLDQAILPILKIVRQGFDADKLEAVTVLGTICDKRPGAVDFLIAEGAVPSVLDLLVKGDLAMKDAAVHCAWLLLKGNRKLLDPAKDALGVQSAKLAQALFAVIEAGSPMGEVEDPAPADKADTAVCDNSDDAVLLLRALSQADPSVRGVLAELALPERQACTVM